MIIDPNIIPDIAVDDASVMLDIPPSITAATGMDALTHAIEAFVSVGAHPLTDANALEAIRLISRWLPKAVEDGHNLEAREQMAFGQYLAGMAFNSAGLGLVHALAHQPAPPTICRMAYAMLSCCRSSKILTARTPSLALPAWRRPWAWTPTV